MNCPNCGTPEQARVKVCPSCGEAYASQDLLELQQLEFLLEKTATWGVPETLRGPYIEQLATLRARLRRQTPTQPEAATATAPLPAPEPAATMPELVRPSQPASGYRSASPREKAPFDQWLLSERNIKLALYTGGLLLVLAGLIFIGVNWTRIPGPGKFAITLMITGLMYLGGYLLFQRPAYRIGGIALLGVASGFLTLNFAVLQIYVLGPSGLRSEVMWLIASPLCLLLYLLTAYWTRGDLFTYMSLAAVGSTVTAALVVIDAPWLVFVLAYALLALAILALARAIQTTWLADFVRLPLLITANLVMPLIILAALVGWVSERVGLIALDTSPWLALLALGVGVLFYALSDALFKWLVARWVAALLFPITFSLVLIELGFSSSAAGISLMALALAYLGLGHALERGEGQRGGAWSLYVTAYAVALFVTVRAIPEIDDLAKALIGDVILLAVSATIYRDYRWICGAVWLFMLPVYLYLDLFVPGLASRGLLMGVLGLNYTAAGFVLGRRELRLGGPFLTAAAFLSLVTVGLTWGNPTIASLVLGAVTVLYFLAALWLSWPWLLLPASLAVNLAVFTLNGIFFESFTTLVQALIVSYAVLGVAFAVGGLGLRRTQAGRWAWPVYLTAALELGGAYLASLLFGGWLVVTLSAVLATVLLAFAWLERVGFIKYKLPPGLTYLGIAVIFVGHFYLIDVAGHSVWDIWPIYTAGLCGLCVALAWLLRHELLAEVYATPLRQAGLWLTLVPMVGAAILFEPFVGAAAFAIVGMIYAADAALRRIVYLAYLALGALVMVIWALLLAFEVSEPQAYVIPLGLALLGMGWSERLRGAGLLYRLPTLLGLMVLMGSAFVQSQEASIYALLLSAESLVAIGWGVRTHSRGYVQVGGLALIVNALAQLGPAFVEWPRWVQLGLIGVILLGGGLTALVKREEILATRQKLTEEWRQWQP
jgi:hypothetical protein